MGFHTDLQKLSVFCVVSSESTSSDNFSIYTETSSSEEDLQNVYLQKLSVFCVVSSESTSSDNFSIYTETSSSEEDLQNVEEPRTSTSSATTHNSRKGKSKSSSTVKRSK